MWSQRCCEGGERRPQLSWSTGSNGGVHIFRHSAHSHDPPHSLVGLGLRAGSPNCQSERISLRARPVAFPERWMNTSPWKYPERGATARFPGPRLSSFVDL